VLLGEADVVAKIREEKVKVMVNVDGSYATSLTTTQTRMPYGITQC